MNILIGKTTDSLTPVSIPLKVPNLIRGSGILLTSSFIFLKSAHTVPESLLYITLVTYLLAFISLALVSYTHLTLPTIYRV